MNHIDYKYCGIVSTRVERFEVKNTNPYKANFRCPICGDSQKSKTKARGWLLEFDNHVNYYCHNCGASMSLGNFLKEIEPTLFNDYVVDTKIESGILSKDKKDDPPLEKLKKSKPKFTCSPLRRIKKVSALSHTHPVRKYIENRRIPSSRHYKLYYAPKFKSWVQSFYPDMLKDTKDEPRLVIPFIDSKGKLFGFTARAFDDKSLRYITIMLDESMPKIFGLDTLNPDKRFFVVEGPIDSLFLDNAIAMAGADIKHINDNAVYVFDNEPRNKQVVDRIEKMIEAGHKVVIWPPYVKEKDINDMVLSGYENIENLLDQQTHSGLMARMRLSNWRKC